MRNLIQTTTVVEIEQNRGNVEFLFGRLRIVPVDFTSVMPDFNQGNNGNLGKYCPPVTNWIWRVFLRICFVVKSGGGKGKSHL